MIKMQEKLWRLDQALVRCAAANGNSTRIESRPTPPAAVRE